MLTIMMSGGLGSYHDGSRHDVAEPLPSGTCSHKQDAYDVEERQEVHESEDIPDQASAKVDDRAAFHVYNLDPYHSLAEGLTCGSLEVGEVAYPEQCVEKPEGGPDDGEHTGEEEGEDTEGDAYQESYDG